MKIYNSHEFIREKLKSITPAMRYNYGEDFSAWQNSAREKLIELLGLPLELCEDKFTVLAQEDCNGYKRINFEFQSEEAYFVSSSILIPEGKSGKLPTVICVQGHSTGMHISLGEAKYERDPKALEGGRDFAIQAVREGMCAITLDQRYMGSAGRCEDGGPSCRRENTAMATLLLGRSAIGERVWDISRLIDVACKHFGEFVDEKKIICLGDSGGGTATFYASCLDERIYLSVPACAVCTFEDSIMAMDHCSCNFIPGIRKYFEMGDLACLIAPRKLIVVCGKEDPMFPIHGVRKSYEIVHRVYKMLDKEKNCVLVEGNGEHQFYPDDVWPVINRFFDLDK